MGRTSLVRTFTDEDFIPLRSFSADGIEADPRDEGLICELISQELTGSEDMNIGIGRLLPGQYHLRHRHPYGSEFYVFLSGECTAYVDGTEIKAGRGTALYLPPNTVHALRNDGTEIVELIYGLNKPRYEEIGLVYDE